ncbi:MAG: nuclear transport factor 2 family protein [Chitinophagaceae bacterium]
MNKYCTLLFLCCMMASTFSLAQSADEKEIAERVETLRKALITPDKAVLQELAADELSYGHSSGLVENKAAFVDALAGGKTVFTAVSFSDQTIKIAGNAAIVRHRMVADLNNNNPPTKIDILVLMVWQKQKGQWKILARQATKTPAAK